MSLIQCATQNKDFFLERPILSIVSLRLIQQLQNINSHFTENATRMNFKVRKVNVM